METLLTSENTGQLWNGCAWDLHSGTSLVSYKGGACNSRTLCTINNRLVISASANRPIIQLWSIHKDQLLSKFVVSGMVTALSISPNGNYAVGSILNKIHVWQVATGNLLTVLSKHYQNISVIRFTKDGSHFITGGDDSLVIVWSLAHVISEQPIETSESSTTISRTPLHVWSKHSLPVSDIYCGIGGSIGAWIVSSSRDMTCNLYTLNNGEHLCKFVYQTAVTSVTMDACNYSLYAGLSNGDIAKVNLYEKNCRDDSSMGKSVNSNKTIFKGHSMAVTCLTTNIDDTKLVSGSRDGSVRVWDINSGQTIRSFKHKGAITNILVIPTPPGMLNNDSKSNIPLYSQFKKHLKLDNMSSEGVKLRIQCRNKKENNEDIMTDIII